MGGYPQRANMMWGIIVYRKILPSRWKKVGPHEKT